MPKLANYIRTDTFNYAKEDYKLLVDQDDTSKIVQQILDLNESVHIDGRA